MTKVSFIYDEATSKWEVVVTGVVSETEACQAFNAVVLTMRDATPKIGHNRAEMLVATCDYKISVGQ